MLQWVGDEVLTLITAAGAAILLPPQMMETVV
jgi:hypothetical protein